MKYKNNCTIKGSDNTIVQSNTEENRSVKPNTWSDPAVTILCIFNFLLGVAAYKFMLWRWV